MRLSDPIHLSLKDVDAVVPDIASIRHSSLTTTPLGQLRYGAVPHAEARQWLESCCRADLHSELRYPRIASFGCDGLGQRVTRMEHLVIRDLDLASLNNAEYHPSSSSTTTKINTLEAVAAAAAGRVVAFAEFKYHPPQEPGGSENTTAQSIQATPDQPPHAPFVEDEADTETLSALPSSVYRDLHEHWDRTVEDALSARFGGMHCFEVRGIGTLAPSHLRKGIASSLLTWIFPWADKLGIPVVLAATPAGHPFYLCHGFVEVDDEDHEQDDPRRFVECDMADWGGSGVHRHVLMMRWSKHAEPKPL